jgi:hypothetical protein
MFLRKKTGKVESISSRAKLFITIYALFFATLKRRARKIYQGERVFFVENRQKIHARPKKSSQMAIFEHSEKEPVTIKQFCLSTYFRLSAIISESILRGF